SRLRSQRTEGTMMHSHVVIYCRAASDRNLSANARWCRKGTFATCNTDGPAPSRTHAWGRDTCGELAVSQPFGKVLEKCWPTGRTIFSKRRAMRNSSSSTPLVHASSISHIGPDNRRVSRNFPTYPEFILTPPIHSFGAALTTEVPRTNGLMS